MHSEFSQLQDGEAEILKLPPQRQVDCLDLGGADADFLRKVLPQVFHVFPNLQDIIVVDDPNILTWANWNELLSKNLLCDPSWTSTLSCVEHATKEQQLPIELTATISNLPHPERLTT
eukprot:Filipodium_phascolosomae@DN2768_c0_g1_i9.p1